MTTPLPEVTAGGVEAGDSTGFLVRRGVARALAEHGLPGIPSTRFHHVALPLLRGRATPCVLVFKTRGQFNVGGTNARDDHRYGVGITVVRASAKSAGGEDERERQFEEWFDRVFRLFAGKRPPFRIPGVCFPEPVQVIDTDPQVAARWVQQLDAMVIQLRVTCREGRRA